MTTDNGIDLVAYSPSSGEPKTIQVKTNLEPKPGGGKGRLALDWWLKCSSPANFVALVDLESEQVWLLSHSEMQDFAQQRPSEQLHFYMYSDQHILQREKAVTSENLRNIFWRMLLMRYLGIKRRPLWRSCGTVRWAIWRGHRDEAGVKSSNQLHA